MPALKRLQKANADLDRAKKAGGIGGKLAEIGASARAAAAFLSLYLIPAVPNEVPADTRLEPAY